ncbi:DUF3800 domain-containing protein [Nakamurella sp. GG22]
MGASSKNTAVVSLCVTRPTLHAFIDELGQRARTALSSPHFVMSAVLVRDTDLGAVAPFLAGLRKDLGRDEGHQLHWKQYKGHPYRLHASTLVGQQQ